MLQTVSNSHGVVRLASSGMVVFVSPVEAAHIPILTSRVVLFLDFIRGPGLATRTNWEGMVVFLYLVGATHTSPFLQFVMFCFRNS